MGRKFRKTRKIFRSKPTIEGAGVKLKRAFGKPEVPQLDPFLLLDDFHSSHPAEYIPGFPWHPHRGMETITYMLNGEIRHQDSMGNQGTIGTGDVQWMTAGSGIIHQEMPQTSKPVFWGFQLWANLPASQKMMDPRYQEVQREQIPVVECGDPITIKVISGEVGGVKGPVRDIVIDPEYLDVSVGPQTVFDHPVKGDHTVFCYVVQGEAGFDEENNQAIGSESVVLFGNGDAIRVTTSKFPVRFILISGRPLGEPVAWYGPIVMNTQGELEQAFDDYRNGTFIKNTDPDQKKIGSGSGAV